MNHPASSAQSPFGLLLLNLVEVTTEFDRHCRFGQATLWIRIESMQSHRVISITNDAPTLCAKQERNQRTDTVYVTDPDHKYHKTISIYKWLFDTICANVWKCVRVFTFDHIVSFWMASQRVQAMGQGFPGFFFGNLFKQLVAFTSTALTPRFNW